MIQNATFIGKLSAIISFFIGTTLFVLFTFVVQSITFLKLGITFILIALLINSFVFIHLIYLAITNPSERFDVIKTCGIMLLNIPVAIGYFYLIIAIGFKPLF